MSRTRIDVHHHIAPSWYADWLATHGIRDTGGHAAIDRGNAAALFGRSLA